jgi:hypothetical protein
MGQASGAARVESKRPGVQWPTVTRPADNTDAPLLPPAPHSCVCGHPVYDEDPKCPLCACQEHKPRLLTTRDHSTPATAWPRADEARRGPQPELPRAPGAAFCNCTPLPGNPCPRTLLTSATPATRCKRRPAVGRPGRTQPPCGRDRTRRRQTRRPWASGPAVAALAPACRHVNIRRTLLPSPRGAPKHRSGARTDRSAQRISGSNVRR